MPLPGREIAMNKKHLYIGLGVTAALVGMAVISLLVARKRNTPRVDLSRFDSPDMPGSGQCMDPEFIKMLQKVAKKTDLPIFDWINSGARSAYWNTKVGGVANSAHKMPSCKAADIKTSSKEIRDRIIQAAKEVGFTRIGIGSTFVHLDNDKTKPQYVAWGYPSGTKPPVNPFA